MSNNFDEVISLVKFDNKGLIPAIAQDVNTGEIVMQAYMNKESLKITLETKKMCYWSRSRQELWVKGETSGNTQAMINAYVDCDGDSLLFKINQKGVACHTGNYSCFYRDITDGKPLQRDFNS